MKRDRKLRYSLPALWLMAIGAHQLTRVEPQARADEPVEWCQTHVQWVAEVGNEGAGAGGTCPTYGRCDRPSVRDLWIPEPPIVVIRLKLHIFCNTDGTNCASPRDGSGVAAQMTQLNSDFAPSRIQFTENTEYINNSTYRDYQIFEDLAMKTTYADDPAHQLNVYVVNFLNETILGLGTLPWSQNSRTTFGGTIVDDGAFGAGKKTLTHECGHNLGMWHIFHGVSEVVECLACYERADGVDGDTTGDFAADTPPAPRRQSCSDPPGDDPCSVPPRPWAPTQPENYMGYAPDPCRTMFTSQQAARMHCWIHDVLMGWIACATNGECDDRSECTEDACLEGVCENNPHPDSTPCAGGVCCGGWCVCSSDADCDDGVECTSDTCANPSTCDGHCENIYPVCDAATPNGCCGPSCTPCNDFDCRSAKELPNSTCRDGVDNDCDGYTDCDDVADCASDPGGDPACFCYTIGGDNPLVCVDWGELDAPELGTDFFLDFGTVPNSPGVTFVTGNDGWKVWSQASAADPTPANLGHIKIDPTLPTANFGVTIAHGASDGAANVASMRLVKEGWTGLSNQSGGGIAGDLEGDLVLQEPQGYSGVASFTIGGNVYGNITIPKVNLLQVNGGVFGNITISQVNKLHVKGTVSSGATITLLGFFGEKRVEFNSNPGTFFAGNLYLPNGLPIDGSIDVYGEFNGDICGANLSATTPLPSNIQIATFGPSATICGEALTVIVWNADALSPDRTTRSLRIGVDAPAISPASPGQSAIKMTMIDLQHPVPANLAAQPPPNMTTYDTKTNGVCNSGTLVGHHCDVDADCPPGVVVGRCASLVACTADPVCTSTAACTLPSNSCARWVGKLGTFYEAQGPPLTGPYKAARLQCTPYYWDWKPEGLLTVVGADIAPSSEYSVEVYGASCMGAEAGCANVSAPVTMYTRRSGDAAPNFNPLATSAQPDALDIAAVVNKLKNLPGALVKAITQLQPNLPELNADINALDITVAVDGVRGIKYGYSGPCACPSLVTCGATACPNGPAPCITAYGAGATCVKSCTGGANAGDPCINRTHCPDGRVCSAGNIGAPCTNNDACNVQGNCVSNPPGAPTLRCTNKVCVGGVNIGLPCDSDVVCPDSTCVGSTCQTHNHCFVPGSCPTSPACGSGYCRDRCGRCTP